MSAIEYISGTTLTTAAASVSFSGIPANYTDLRFIIQCKTTHTAHSALLMGFNGDATTNYSYTRMYGNGSATFSDRFTSQPAGMDVGFMPNSASGFGTIILDVMSYSNLSTFKPVLDVWETVAGAVNNQFVLAEVGLWRSTAAITSATFTFPVGSVVAGSTFSMWGVR